MPGRGALKYIPVSLDRRPSLAVDGPGPAYPLQNLTHCQ